MPRPGQTKVRTSKNEAKGLQAELIGGVRAVQVGHLSSAPCTTRAWPRQSGQEGRDRHRGASNLGPPASSAGTLEIETRSAFAGCCGERDGPWARLMMNPSFEQSRAEPAGAIDKPPKRAHASQWRRTPLSATKTSAACCACLLDLDLDRPIALDLASHHLQPLPRRASRAS
ncbi:hypothetical protein CCMA1212_001529 [Trichoderma ghanense]|uniref:Uncharacterized protein n=1 Tax=Trichoderma ghanense TaxID=65468 RepID=A0ABY2HG58_9HYPO